MPSKVYVSILVMVSVLAPALFADDGNDSVVFARPWLFMSQEATRVVHGGQYINVGGNLNDDWFLPTVGGVDFKATKNDRLSLEVQLVATYFAAPDQYAVPQNYVRNILVSAPKLDASYIFGDLSHPFLKVDLGNFREKYDENSRNLGEYMFRSWAYPGIIQTGGAYGYVGDPQNTATLTGIKFSQSLGMFSHEFLATIETEFTPLYDVDLTYMAKFNYHDIFKIGGGVQLARVLSADLTSNSLPQMTVHYFSDNGTWYAAGSPGASYYSALQLGIEGKLAGKGVSHADSTRLNKELAQDTLALAVLDSVSNGQLHPDMKHFTAQAIKPVLYFSFDPKPLMQSRALGPNDLVLYGEAAVLGVQDHPVFYTDVWKRIPVTLGINLPTFKLLDVLALEVEYYGSQWEPTYPYSSAPAYNASPAPYIDGAAGSAYYPTDWDKDNWKWSVYAERNLIHGVSLSGQVASDHARTWDWVTFGKTPFEVYTSPSQWYWGLKLTVKI